jgi:hypothetical protein
MEKIMKRLKCYALFLLICCLISIGFGGGTSTYTNVSFSLNSTSLRDGFYPLRIELFSSQTSSSVLWFMDALADTSFDPITISDGKIHFYSMQVPRAIVKDLPEIWAEASYLGVPIALRTIASVEEPVYLEALETDEAAAVGLEVGVSTEDVYFAANRVGIGTTTPSEVLEVVGNVKGTSFVGNGSSLTQMFHLDANDANPQNALYVDASGNVGIGTTAPASNLQVNGEMRIGDCTSCSSTNAGTLRYNSTNKVIEFCNGTAWQQFGSSSGLKGACVYRWMAWSNYAQWYGWYCGNSTEMFAGVNPSNWADGGYRAVHITSDKNSIGGLFSWKGYAMYNANIFVRKNRHYSSTEARFVGVVFRIKNNSGSAQTWTPYYYYTSYGSWSNYASMSINGNELWYTSGNSCSGSARSQSVTIPANQTSTVIVLSSFWMGCNCSGHRGGTQLVFYNNSLALPTGCEYVDDLDTAPNGWNY